MIRMSAFVVLAALTLGVAAHGATTAVIRGTPQSDEIQGTQANWSQLQSDNSSLPAALNSISAFLLGNVLPKTALDGRGGSDVIYGGLGNDTLSGGGAKDYLSGGEGDDTLSAAYGERRPVDFLSCGAGDDLVILVDVPDVDRGVVRRLLDGAPSYCELVRFTR